MAGEPLTLIGMCKRNGIDPASGPDRLLDDPDWVATADGAAGGEEAAGEAEFALSPPPWHDMDRRAP